jgi:hypothetical protein
MDRILLVINAQKTIKAAAGTLVFLVRRTAQTVTVQVQINAFLVLVPSLMSVILAQRPLLELLPQAA